MTRAPQQALSDMTDELALHPAEPPVMQAQHGPEGGTPLRRAQRSAAESTGIDLDAAQRAAADFLAALGVELDREELRATPARMARAYAELFQARPLSLTTFPNDEEYDELVLARDIPFRTVCEHHLLPFSGVAHVGYLPGERILGLSKLARLVEHFAARPHDPRSRAEFFSLARVPGLSRRRRWREGARDERSAD